MAEPVERSKITDAKELHPMIKEDRRRAAIAIRAAIGVRYGIFKELASTPQELTDVPGAKSQKIANRTGIDPNWLADWLQFMASPDVFYVSFNEPVGEAANDRKNRRYYLSDAQKEILANQDDPNVKGFELSLANEFLTLFKVLDGHVRPSGFGEDDDGGDKGEDDDGGDNN